MRTLLRLAYDGTDFSGCPALAGERTVCGELRAALERVDLAPSLIETLSRTDAGVHARGNVAHVVLPRPVQARELLSMLDRHLPLDVRAHAAWAVPELPPVLCKTYRYSLDLHPHGDPAVHRTAWRPPGAVDATVFERALRAAEGTHDFEAFRRTGETRQELTRTLTDIRVEVEGHALHAFITGSGFVYRMVRSLVGGAVTVARGGASLADFVAAIDGVPSGCSRQTAPAKGLCLLGMKLEDRALED
ncbi:MAG: hypothetical protein AB8H79_23510 [Myxococcota bacterium]